MHIATAPGALADQRLHRAGLAAYWRAVDRAIAREVAAIEAAERAALAEARVALAEAEAEHAALLSRVSAVDAADRSAAIDAVPSDSGVDDAKNDGLRERAEAMRATLDFPASVAGLPVADAAPAVAEGDETAAQEEPMDDARPDAVTIATAIATGPIAASLEAAAARRRAALAACDDRLAPVRAEREALQAALAAVLQASVDLRGPLAETACAGAWTATA